MALFLYTAIPMGQVLMVFWVWLVMFANGLQIGLIPTTMFVRQIEIPEGPRGEARSRYAVVLIWMGRVVYYHLCASVTSQTRQALTAASVVYRMNMVFLNDLCAPQSYNQNAPEIWGITV